MDFWYNRTWITSGAIFGSTLGAAGWILGASDELASAGRSTDAALVLLCASGVFLTGGILWVLWLTGRRLNLFVLIDALLGASFVFGALALWIMQSRGVVAAAIDSAGNYPEWMAYAAPVGVFAVMAITWFPPMRRRLLRTKLERNAPGEPQSQP